MKFRDYTKYEVFEDGRIWTYSHKKFLKPCKMKNGYQTVQLSDNEGNIKRYLVHRVVYESFSGEPIPEGMQVNHISEDKDENFFSNLNLMSSKDNCNWVTRNERLSKVMINNPKLSKSLTNNPKISKSVGAYKNGELVMTFQSTNEAGRNGFNQGHVAACCRNCYMREGNNVYKGYEWRYI